MTEPPPRKRFQIHLSTAIVMMFVAGGVMWANLRSSTRDYGWPWIIYVGEMPYCWIPLILDIAGAQAILYVVWIVSEWLIRRRAARKGA